MIKAKYLTKVTDINKLYLDEIINEDILREIYEMDFNVQEIDGNKISIYY